jgi:hypothetical protein
MSHERRSSAPKRKLIGLAEVIRDSASKDSTPNHSMKSFHFILNPLDVQCSTPVEVIPEHFVARANNTQVEEIKTKVRVFQGFDGPLDLATHLCERTAIDANKDPGTIRHQEPILTGVEFIQLERKKGERVLVGHGPNSIYRQLNRSIDRCIALGFLESNRQRG